LTPVEAVGAAVTPAEAPAAKVAGPGVDPIARTTGTASARHTTTTIPARSTPEPMAERPDAGFCGGVGVSRAGGWSTGRF
jgi:hypothetical protein